MKVKKVPITEIVVPDTRVTAVYDEATAEVLRQTVEKLGVLTPVVVIHTDHGYELVDGLHRLEEAKHKGDDYLDAVVYEGSAADTMLLNLILNRARGKTKASEMVQVIYALYEEHGVGIEEIQEKTGLSRGYVENLIRISKAAPGVLQALDQEIIGVGHALELIRLPTMMQQEDMIAKQSIWRWPVKDLREFVSEVLRLQSEIVVQPPEPVVTHVGRYYCDGCRLEAEAKYLRPVMLCPNCYGVVYQKAKEAQPQAMEAAAHQPG